MCQGSFQGSKVGELPETHDPLLTWNKTLLQPGTEMQCKSFGDNPEASGRIILRTEHARLPATTNLFLTAAAQEHRNDHPVWPPPWHRSEGHQWSQEQPNYHSTDLLPFRLMNPFPGSIWACWAYLDGKIDKTTDIERILHQVKYELHVLYQRQVVWHSQGKAGDLFQDIARYLQVQDNTQYYLPLQKFLSRPISPFLQEAALSNAKGHSQGPGRTAVFKVSYLRCDLVLIKVRKVLELCKDIFSCWECFWLALFPLLAFLSTYQSWEDQKTVLGYLPHQRRPRHQPSAPASPSARSAPAMQHSQKAGVPDLKLIRIILNSKQ